MAIDATSVYWTDCGDPTGGYVRKVPKAGGGLVTLATGDRLSGIAVEGTNVYWVASNSTASSGTIMTVPVTGGTPTVVAAQSGAPAHIAVDASYVYWGELMLGNVMRAPLGGGTPTAVAATSSGIFQIALGDTAVFWLAGMGLMTAPKAGGVAVALTPPFPPIPTDGLAVNATTVYINAGNRSGAPGILEVPIQGASFDAGSLFPGIGGGPIAIDAKRAYWADMSGSVYGASLAGGAAILLATGQNNVDAIAVDDVAVYWLDNGNATPGGGSVMKLALSAVAWP
jgi:hypothetical protein